MLATATSVEQIALTGSADPVITGTTFGNSFMALSLPTVVPIAALAAADQTVAEAANVGVGVGQLSKVIAVPSLTGSVAFAVAGAATEFLIPSSPTDLPTADNNYSYYTVAGAFASAFAGNSKLPADATAIAGALAVGLQGQTGATGAQNQSAAAIAYDLSEALINLGYSSKNAGYIQALSAAVAAVDPQAVADIYGYVAEALKASSWTTAQVNETLYGGALLTFATQSGTNLVSALEAATSNAYNTDIGTANGELAGFGGGDGTYVTADETPIVNF